MDDYIVDSDGTAFINCPDCRTLVEVPPVSSGSLCYGCRFRDDIIKNLESRGSTTNKRLNLYMKAINDIDDYFEYACASRIDQTEVHMILEELTNSLKRTQCQQS